jgi:IclR family transcriptional regulator, acetate operon repressor
VRKSRPAISSAAAVLALVRLVARRGSVTVTEVSRELDVAVSTAHRLLATCVHEGFVRQDHVGGPYLAGPALHELTLVVGSNAVSLRDAGADVLTGLREELGETVSVAILEGRGARFVQSLEGPQSVRVSSRLGRLLPAHSTSGGKAMLAALSSDALQARYPSHHLEATTARSITDWDALQRELARIRRRGWAVNLGETDPSVAALGAAVLLGTGEPVAAVCVAAPMSRLGTATRLRALAPAVIAAASLIQQRLRGS